MTEYEHVTKEYILQQTFPFTVGFYQWICHMPDRLTLIENIISTIISISLITYGTTRKNGKKIPCSH